MVMMYHYHSSGAESLSRHQQPSTFGRRSQREEDSTVEEKRSNIIGMSALIREIAKFADSTTGVEGSLGVRDE